MIKVQHINKAYGQHLAVKDLSFSVEKGRIYGLLGANGAGKTTTLSILTGCLAPDSGTVTVDGRDLLEDAVAAKRKIGYLPEVAPLYGELTPLEHISFVWEAKGLPKEQREQHIRTVVSALSLKGVLHRQIKNLSKGYRQRVGLAAALLGEPEVLILDEPMVGLDPMQIVEIRDLLKAYAQEHTVILSSHILSEMDRLCDRVLILSHGVLVAEDSPERLGEEGNRSVLLELSVKATREQALSALRCLEQVKPERAESQGEQTLLLLRHPSGRDWRPDVFFAFAEAGLPILSMNRRQASLEQIFLELSGGDDRNANPKGEKKE